MKLSKNKSEGMDFAMDTLLNKFKSVVNGVISGFDRIVFKGMIQPLVYAGGMEYFLRTQNILNKDFKDYAMKQSQIIVSSAEKISETECGIKPIYLPSCNTRKETLAHEQQEKSGKKEGLIGVWTSVERCNTFRSTFNPNEKYPMLKNEQSKCKHLYFYYDDRDYGFMSVRLQTWAPYEIQIALNGREWLRRSLDKNNCKYIMDGNKFLHIDDYELAQRLLNAQFNADFEKILNGFLPSVFPCMHEIVGEHSYYWTLWQSEVAKDYIFKSTDDLNPLMDNFLLHALLSGTGDRILRYFGSPIKKDGQPYANSHPEIISKATMWYDGLRVRHWNGKNSVKFYNEHKVLRFEMTMNDPAQFKIHRHTMKQDKSEPKKMLPLRKGIADISNRAEISTNIVNRFTEHMSTLEDRTPLSEIVSAVSSPLTVKGKKVRSLDVFGKDLELICAISDPAFDVSGMTNKDLQKKLGDSKWAKDMTGKQLSGRISRHFSLLREHGLIKKLPNQHKYVLTQKGRTISTAISVSLSASINKLLDLAV